jgi:1-deoxyxylulose-5-phosphate synthase
MAQAIGMRVGLGCASAWGQPWFPEREAIALVHRALDLGVRVLDTGPSYSGGHAEPRLGRALRGRDLDGLLISTKVGTHTGPFGRLVHDLSPAAVVRSVDASRRNLGVDQIPLLYLHGPGIHELGPRLLDSLEDLRERGWVSRFGVNSYDPPVVRHAARLPVFTTFMVDYNLLRADREPLLATLQGSGRQVVSGSALANHLYAAKYLFPSQRQDVWYLLRFLKNYRRDWWLARHLCGLRDVPGWTPAQLALGFVLANPTVDVAMFGTTRMGHLEENLSAAQRELPPAVMNRLRAMANEVGQIAAR